MGRKTNSVSLRLKKTNKDFNDCWYGDILYSENLLKSFKIKALLSQTLKSAAVPCAHLSLIGAFKKSNIFVGYLDPEPTRKYRSESFYLKMYPRLPDNQRPAESLLLAMRSKHSKTLRTNSKPLTLLCLLGTAKLKVPGFACHALPLQSNCIAKTAKGSCKAKKGNCKDIDWKTNLPNISTHCSMARKSQSFTFARNIADNASLGLVLHSKFGLQDKKPHFEGKNFIITTHYKCPTAFPYVGLALQSKHSTSNSLQSFPEKFLSVLSTLPYVLPSTTVLCYLLCKASQVSKASSASKNFAKQLHSKLPPQKAQPVSEKCSLPIYHIFRLIKFLYSVKTAFGEIEYKHVDNKTYNWFFQRKSFFCATEISNNVNLAYTKGKPIKEKKKRLHLVASSAFGPVVPCLAQQLHSKTYRQQKAETGKDFTYSRRLLLPSNHTYSNPQSLYVESISPYFKRLQNKYSSFWGHVLCISLYKSVNEKSSALFLANSIAYYLERRVLFRRLKRQLLLELPTLAFALQSKPGKAVALQLTQSAISAQHRPTSRPMFDKNTSKIAGIRVSCSGRVGGRSKKAQRSRKETLMWGETGLHVFSSKLDFARTHAETGFGVVGIQVWICYK